MTKTEYRTRCATAKSRTAMANAVQSLAERYGATVTRKSGALPGDERRMGVFIATGPYGCMMHFDGRSHVDAFLGHWYMEGGDGHYPAEFGADIRGSRNLHHGRKATSCHGTFAQHLASLEGGLRCLAENGLAGRSPAAADSGMANHV